jgi:DNA ligase-1|nr:MAG TPA: DNA ligase [Caudoviricetes sp.]
MAKVAKPSIKPMLAGTVKHLGELKDFPYLCSRKLDGVRALIIDGKVYSRSLKLIPNKHVQELFGKEEFNGFDGELIIGAPNAHDVYNRTVSGVMSHDGEPDVHYYIFDLYDQGDDDYEERYRHIINANLPSNIHVVESFNANNVDDVLAFEIIAVEKEKYEGIMLRKVEKPYKFGRSTLKEGGLLKFKRFTDDEAVILAITEKMKNENEAFTNELGATARSLKKEGMVAAGTMGAILVKNTEGVEFEVGTGFTDEQRQYFWDNQDTLIGKTIKYRYQKVGVKEKPRFPSFIGFRDEVDM